MLLDVFFHVCAKVVFGEELSVTDLADVVLIPRDVGTNVFPKSNLLCEPLRANGANERPDP